MKKIAGSLMHLFLSIGVLLLLLGIAWLVFYTMSSPEEKAEAQVLMSISKYGFGGFESTIDTEEYAEFVSSINAIDLSGCSSDFKESYRAFISEQSRMVEIARSMQATEIFPFCINDPECGRAVGRAGYHYERMLPWIEPEKAPASQKEWLAKKHALEYVWEGYKELAEGGR